MLALRHYPSVFNSNFLRPFAAGAQFFVTSSSEPHTRLTLEQKLGLPEKPKRPLTPYIRFIKESYHKVIPEKGIKAQDSTKILSEEWKKVDEATKKKMLDEFHKQLAEYPKLLKNYLDSLSDSERVKLEAAKVQKKEAKKKRELLSEERKTGKPSRPPNMYALFVADQFSKLGLPHKVSRETSQELTKKWNTLSPEEKKKYEDQFKASKEDYEKKIIEWEAEMIKQGKESLIRQKSRPAIQPSPKSRRERKTTEASV